MFRYTYTKIYYKKNFYKIYKKIYYKEINKSIIF